MKDNPAISIIMPVYNGKKYLEESVESVLQQTFSDFELIIIDDSSTDNSKRIAQNFASKDKRVKIIDNKYQKGIHGALNSGLDESSGFYIARADGDDINRPYRLKTQISFLENHPDIDIVGSGYQLFGNGSNRKIFHPSSSLKLAWGFITNTYFCHPSVMFRRAVLSTIPHYPNAVCEDFAFFSKIIQKHKGVNIKKILIDYRQHNSNYSNTQGENIKISIKETFLENYKFYTNSLKNSEIFYNFHFKKELRIKDVFKIIKISFIISQNILKQYNIKNYSFKAFYLYSIIKIDILKALTFPYLKKIYKFIKKI